MVLALIKTYQYVVSPVLSPACRFYPTCSDYAHQAIGKHGLLLGGRLAFTRICRCHPYHPGGFDPVPDKGNNIHVPRSDVSGMIGLTRTTPNK